MKFCSTQPGVIFIFDLDGVLIDPRGYIEAYLASLKYILPRLGLKGFHSTPILHSLFESIGISWEWDMLPLTIALVLEEAMAENPDFRPSKELNGFYFPKTQARLQRTFKIHQKIVGIKQFLQKGVAPSKSVFDACIQQKKRGYFPNLSQEPFFEGLLGHTRDIQRSFTSQLFQAYCIGSDQFQAITSIRASVNAESMLMIYDKSLLYEWEEQELKTLYRDKEIACAVCTARPSIPDDSCPPLRNFAFPEMDSARHLLHFEDIPMIGWGEICALAEYMNQNPDNYMKPQPLQMLTAIAASFGYRVWDALLWAAGIISKNVPVIELSIPKSIELHVFEDMTNGLLAAQEAKIHLEKRGFLIELYMWGITKDIHKCAALRRIGAKVFPHVNMALKEIRHRKAGKFKG